MVVFAYMPEAEAPVLVLAIAAFGGAVGRRPVAARPLTARVLGAQPTILVGLDPNTIEQGRVAGHRRIIRMHGENLQVLTKRNISKAAAINSRIDREPHSRLGRQP